MIAITLTQPTAMLLSIAMEVPIALFLFWLMQKPVTPVQIIKLILVSTAATLMSHPVAWWLFRALLPTPYLTRFFEIETGVFIFEAIIYWRLTSLNFRKSLFVSLIANATSAGIGYWMVT